MRHFGVSKPLSARHSVDYDDVLATKRALWRLGYYRPPGGDFHGWTDNEVFAAVEAFQRDQGLEADGVILPDSATVSALSKALEAQGAGGDPGGTVQRGADTRRQDAEMVQMQADGAPPAGPAPAATPPLPRRKPIPPKPDLPASMTAPVPNTQIRGQDAYGGGAYGARRDGGRRAHNGVDIVTASGQTILSPVSGRVRRTDVDPYGDKKYGGVEIETDDGYTVKMFYLDPTAVKLREGQRVEAGKTPLGTAQDLSVRYPPARAGRITNHVHIEVRKGGVLKDPTPLITGSRP